MATTQGLPRHLHPEYEIAAWEGGAGTLRYRGSVYAAQKGRLRLLQSGEAHTATADKETGITLRILNIAPVLLSALLDGLYGLSQKDIVFPVCDVTDAEICDRFLVLHRLLEQPMTLLERQSCLQDFFAVLAVRHAEDRLYAPKIGQEHQAVETVKGYIAAAYAEDVSLATLAQITGLSPFYLTRVFCREVGLPPHAYQTQMRIAHARTLLIAGHAAGVVAQKVGFYDQTHFNRHFKRLMGVTPGEYAR